MITIMDRGRKTYKIFASVLLGVVVMLGCFTGAQAKVPLNGEDKLYADLNHDGHVERVSIIQYSVPVDGGKTPGKCLLARIVVFSDTGKVLWRGPQATNSWDIWNDARILVLSDGKFGPLNNADIFLHDLDGDGCIELCMDNDLTAPGVYRVLRWKNDMFMDTYCTTFACIGDGEYKLGGAGINGQSALVNLQKANGKLIADCWNQDDSTLKKAQLIVDKDGILRIKKYL